MADHKMNDDRARSRLLRPLAVLGAAVITTVAFIGGCSDDDASPKDEQPPSASGSPTSAARSITTKLTIGKVTGRLGNKQKAQLKADITEVVDAYFESAFLGEFPRATFDKAYTAFTDGARADAKRDADLLSNAGIADRIDVATGTKRRVALDVFAVKGQAQGVTARFTLDFATTGELERSERVKGYLLLDHEGDGWQVFGYDVLRSVIA